MNQFFIGIIIVLGLGSWYLFNENQTLTENNIKLEYMTLRDHNLIDQRYNKKILILFLLYQNIP